MGQALFIGGTKGLGLALAREADEMGILQVILGSSIDTPMTQAKLPPFAEGVKIDLTAVNPFKEFGKLAGRKFDYIFWVAGVFMRRKPLAEMYWAEINNMISVHLYGSIRLLQLLHSEAIKLNHPYHLVTIASTSSWRMRDNETLYCALKAAKAALTRNFARELVRDLPGSKVTLVNPGGIKTPNFWAENDQDISKFMEPDEVAEVIWDQVQEQAKPFEEMQIMRNDDGTPNVSFGPHLPELPS